jgi:ComF family protein
MLDASVTVNALARRLLPLRCVVCDTLNGSRRIRVCAPCEHDFFAADCYRCERCAICLPASQHAVPPICGRCLADTPHFDATTTLGNYASPVDGMVTAMKFTARLDLANFFGRLLAERVPADHLRGGIVIPVPLAYERLRERGFNQSHQIAHAFAAAASRRLVTDRLLRVRHTAPQLSLALTERRRNVRDAFAVQGTIKDESIFVVDDVMTTGNTLNEIARVLKRAGAVRVHNLVVARTP